MEYLTLERIAAVCDGTYVGEESKKGAHIRGAVTDSRQIKEGYLFLPVKGERVDGHDFIPAVFEQGALATLTEKPLKSCPGPYIRVESTLASLKKIAAYYRSQLSIPVVGITGSVGKTSTKEMIASVLSEKYHVLKTAGNFNNEIGLPLTILRIQKEHEVAVVEMGISEFGEMGRLAEIARPDLCVITNIGTCHLENLGDREGVLKAKTEVFDYLEPGAAVFLNGDDDKLAGILRAGDVVPLFYGRNGQDIFMDEIEELGLKGSRAKLHTPQGNIQVEIPIPGSHHLYNAMAAAGVALRLGLTLEEIREGIANAKTIAGRSNFIEAGGCMIIDDCYNANPMSMKASLDVLRYGRGRTVAILGDMGELGRQERQLHYEVGTYAVDTGVDVLLCVGELAKEMERGALECLEKQPGRKTKIFYYPSREEMLAHLKELIEPGDTILVKASHFMNFSEAVKRLQEI